MAWQGAGHRKNTTAMSHITVTALSTLTGRTTVTAVPTLTGHITVEADPITATIIPVTTITVAMTNTTKAVSTKLRRIAGIGRIRGTRSITTMIRANAGLLPPDNCQTIATALT